MRIQVKIIVAILMLLTTFAVIACGGSGGSDTLPPTYTVTFDSQSPTVEASPTSKTVTSPATTVDALPSQPTKLGYTFAGWYTGIGGSGTEFTASTLVTASITVFAKWDSYSYTVTYNSDGGSAVSPQSVNSPATTVGTLPATPTKTGYTFGGWTTIIGGGGTVFIGSTPVTGNITVFAKWTPITYTVTYNSDGGTAVGSQFVTFPATTVGTLPAAPTKTGYTFGGWTTIIGGGGTAFIGSTPVTGNITVFAKWDSYSYTVTYNSDGGSAVSPQSVNSPATTVGTLPAAPTKTGYTFGGWTTIIGGGGTAFIGSTPVTGNITVFAKWDSYSYTVTYNSDGGSAVSPQSVNSPATTVGTLPAAPTKTGYTFGGWTTIIGGGGTVFIGSTPVTGNITVFAKWDSYTYTVTFDSQSPTVPASPTSKTVASPATTVDALPSQPTKLGSDFGGWYTGTNGSGTEFTASTSVTGNIKVYAKWTAITYTVTFNYPDTTPYGSAFGILYGNTATLPVPPTKLGSDFAGWYTGTSGTGAAFDGSTSVTADITVYAKWTPITYTVTFNSQSATVEASPTSRTALYGNTVTLPTAPTKLGSDFGGWYTGTNGSGTAFNDSTTITGNITVYAKWTAITYTITFNYPDATSYGSAFGILYGNTATLPVQPTKLGYTFAGWYTGSSGTGTEFTASTLVTASITVYANWTADTYTINFDSQSPTVPASPTFKTVTSPATNVGTLPTAPTKLGYTFAGWYTGISGSGTEFTASTLVTASITVYANWTANTYTVTFDSQSPTVPASPTFKTVTSPATNVDALPTPPTKTIYTFDGWYTGTKGSGTEFTTSTAVTADITVYAKWKLLTMITVPAGSFQRDATETNVSYVSAFQMSEKDITRAQFTTVTGLVDPTDVTHSSGGTSDPVQQANWYHALVFCNMLSMAEGLDPVYTVTVSSVDKGTDPADWGAVPTLSNSWSATANWSANGYRLPTEMEWMWAAMGATSGFGYTGPIYLTGYAKAFAGSTGSNSIDDYDWYGEGDSGTTHPVGTKLANELGLYDMSGNVYQWCWDMWDGAAGYPDGPLSDYKGGAAAVYHIIHGGSFYNSADWTTIAFRNGFEPIYQWYGIGFRVVRNN